MILTYVYCLRIAYVVAPENVTLVEIKLHVNAKSAVSNSVMVVAKKSKKRIHHSPQTFTSDDSGIDTGIEQSHHDLGGAAIFNDIECCSNDEYFKDEKIVTQAMLIATLDEKFGMTGFKHF